MATSSVPSATAWVSAPVNSSKPVTGPWTSKTTCMQATRALAASPEWLRRKRESEEAGRVALYHRERQGQDVACDLQGQVKSLDWRVSTGSTIRKAAHLVLIASALVSPAGTA